MIDWKRIIGRMVEIARRLWITFFSVFGALIIGGIQVLCFYNGKYLYFWLIPILILALISLGIAITMLIYDIKQTWRKEHPPKKKVALR